MSIQNLKTLSAAAILAFAVASPAMADDNAADWRSDVVQRLDGSFRHIADEVGGDRH
jgi:hypothetical protein